MLDLNINGNLIKVSIDGKHLDLDITKLSVDDIHQQIYKSFGPNAGRKSYADVVCGVINIVKLNDLKTTFHQTE